MRKFLTRFKKSEAGATAIEYGLIAALMSVVVIGAVTQLKAPMKDSFEGLGKTLNNQAPKAGATAMAP